MSRVSIGLLCLALVPALFSPGHAEDESAPQFPQAVPVPEVTGLSEQDAIDKLEAAGFHADVVSVDLPRLTLPTPR